MTITTSRILTATVSLTVILLLAASYVGAPDEPSSESSSTDSSDNGAATSRVLLSGSATDNSVAPRSGSAAGSSASPGTVADAGEPANAVSAAPAADPATLAVRAGADAVEPGAPRLSERVRRVLEEVQARQLDDQWDAALNEMNALYGEFDSLTPFEQSTLLNFYTNTLIQLQLWQEAISAFTLMLTVEELRPDVTGRALMALGQLSSRVGDRDVAIAYYEEWLRFTAGQEGLERQTGRVQQQLGELGNN